MKGGIFMCNTTITSEISKIAKQLTPENQRYFLTLLRIAAVAENAVKKQNNINENKVS